MHDQYLKNEKIASVPFKAMIKKSYGTEMRPAVLYFNCLAPDKGHCSCPVGASGMDTATAKMAPPHKKRFNTNDPTKRYKS